MPIPAVVESEDQLPEGLADYYEQNDDGKFVLSADDIDSHPNVQNLKTSLQKQKQDREKLRKERDSLKSKASLIPDDVDEETLQQALERIQSDDGDANTSQDSGGEQKQSGNGQDNTAKVRERLEKQYNQQLQEKDEALKSKDQQLRSLVVDNGLTSALQKHGVTNATYQKAAKRLLSEQVQVQEDDNGNPRAVVETDLGEQSLEQFVKDWVSGDEGAAFVAGNQGSGARGGSGTSGNRKEMTRAQFDALSPDKKREFSVNGGRIVD